MLTFPKAHMAEELQDAAYTLPRILTVATAINGALMFIMCITICYTIGDLTEGKFTLHVPYNIGLRLC